MSTGGDDGTQLPQPKAESSRAPIAALVALVLILAVALGVQWLWGDRRAGEEQELEAPVGVAQQEVVVPPAPPPPPGPPQRDSDAAQMRAAARGACLAPTAVAWLAPDDIVQRFVAAVDLIARGDSPAEPLAMLAPSEPFHVVRRDDKLVMSRRSQARYRDVVAAIADLDARACAKAYEELRPVFERTYREIAPAGVSFDEVLAQAIHRVAAVRVPTHSPSLSKAPIGYRYVSPRLEGASDVEKHLLRMGSDNARRLQRKLRELRGALSLATTGS